MAQILAPSTQWQMRVPKSSTFGSPIATKMWSSLLLKQNMKGAAKSAGKFKVLGLHSENSTVNRIEKLLNMDVTPYTDKIIAEYIWYIIIIPYTYINVSNITFIFGSVPIVK